MFKLITVVILFECYKAISQEYVITELSSLPLDKNDHLDSHWLLATRSCGTLSEYELLQSNYIGDKLAREAFNYLGEGCFAVCLERGTPSGYLSYPIPINIYDHTAGESLSEWVHKQCLSVEIGFISYNPNPAIVYWLSPDGGKVKISDLLRTEYHTFWTNSYLGHRFQIIDSITKSFLGNFTAEYNGFFPIGDAGSFVGTDIGNEDDGVSSIFRAEFQRSRRIKRTFTELGFSKGRLPHDVWGSLQAYYYNNQNHYVREEYENKGLTVNWYEVDPKFIGMPWGIKRYWQSRLKDVVQDWIGNLVEIENTDIYGMRRYEDGARLLTHVDREATHAVSLIVNIAQFGVRKPWYVEIYDHADRLHQVEMEPGDIVYYESARCLHGRMTPLEGSYYVNLFTHYRPVGDPQWFTKPNPEGTPKPLIDITDIEIATLSPHNHVVKSHKDLYDFWKRVSPAEKKHVLAQKDEL